MARVIWVSCTELATLRDKKAWQNWQKSGFQFISNATTLLSQHKITISIYHIILPTKESSSRREDFLLSYVNGFFLSFVIYEFSCTLLLVLWG